MVKYNKPVQEVIMGGKILIGIILVFSLLLASCYPELSVQQYDQLRADLEALDTQRQELMAQAEALQGQVEALQEQVATFKTQGAQTLLYIRFMDKLVSTQKSELILEGQFDVGTLIEAKAELLEASESLVNGDISYYLGLMLPENESQTVGAYYKIIEYCVKKMITNLE